MVNFFSQNKYNSKYGSDAMTQIMYYERMNPTLNPHIKKDKGHGSCTAATVGLMGITGVTVYKNKDKISKGIASLGQKFPQVKTFFQTKGKAISGFAKKIFKKVP